MGCREPRHEKASAIKVECTLFKQRGSPWSLCPCLAFYTPFNTEEEELPGCFTYILTLTPKTHFKVQRKFHSFLFLQPPIRVSSAAATLTCETDRRWTCDAIKSDLANI